MLINPFIAGRPVSGEHFYGRKKEIQEINSRIERARRNIASDGYVTLYGYKGMGKSSILQQIQKTTDADKDVLFISVDVSSTENYDNFLETIVNRLLNESQKNQGVLDKVKSLAEKIDGLTIGSYGITWKKDTSPNPSQAFVDIVPQIWAKIKESSDFKALVIIIDEMDSLERVEQEIKNKYAHGFKNISNTWQVEQNDILIIISCLNDIWDSLIELQDSNIRFFKLLPVKPFTHNDIEEMFSEIFEYGEPKKSASPAYIKELEVISGGEPYYLQAVSKETFDVDSNNLLDIDDYNLALPEAITIVEAKMRSILANTNYKRAIRVLRCTAENITITRPSLMKAVQATLNGESEYRINEEYESGEEDLELKESQIDNALSFLIKGKGLMTRVTPGEYRIINPLTRLWINVNLGGYSIEEATKLGR